MAAVEALVDRSRTTASARDEYVSASADAMMKVAPQPFSSAEALTAWMNAAANRWRLQPEPISIAELFPFIEKHGGHDD
jgi:3-oxoacyl-(acyl-carrier-protein) synthase